MGLFDFFGSKKSPVEKHAGRVADRRAQAPDRWDSIQALGALKSPEAVQALLARFTIYADPSITDQEEKDETFRLIVETGAPAIDPVVAFLRRSESLGWPLKLLDRLVPAERVVTELLAVLETMDTEYQRDPTRKVQVLQTLEDRRDVRIAPAVARFLEDVNETARFHAIAALFAQEDPSPARAAAQKALSREDSVRGRTRLLEAFAERGWDVGEGRAAIEKTLPAGWSLDKAGVPRKKG
ncbi:HEAT repeat domain-containing protein [Sandaracinus amylolyticus]|uniref:HEAT repeat domain-containing protein n=1 Tax=Sandaracinus amylolyticus TaxID=927083 RepID=UPI001F290868|nr:HEAT repeat domain-containing protein [Sandaracinus amylolyticus]UJR80347.1 HEAT repeat domain-containing protein [Sandaracinus amylolyticus]